MKHNLTRTPGPAAPPTASNTATTTPPAPANASMLREAGRTALLALATRAPAPILVAVIDWWLKTH
ncbi:hypothetical protein [Kitasatospora sp. NBC_00315]|uniref:hypothetical protein n=1 Tax=Kitasatospora sp. NBC_00315 TaxID=2975963 RepID=UPI0032479603